MCLRVNQNQLSTYKCILDQHSGIDKDKVHEANVASMNQFNSSHKTIYNASKQRLWNLQSFIKGFSSRGKL